MDQSMMVYVIAGLAFVSIVGIGFAFAGGSSAPQQKRVRQATGVVDKREVAKDATHQRRKQMADSIKALREKEASRRKDNNVNTLPDKIKQAGFSFDPSVFWMGSAALGVTALVVAFLAGLPYAAVAGIGFAAGLGLPRWLLGMAVGMRQKKFSMQFADAIDVIVRGVKSGLPLNECLRIIAAESPQPVGGEFARVVDNMQMGASVDKALERMYRRVPLPEVNFFSIVISIQQQAGGNLSEALGNLSGVLRSRKMLKEKIKALSSEAKASAMIIGSLPVAVMGLVYVTTPSYILELFTHPVGHMLLMIGAALMGLGIFIMRQMINFDF